MGITIDESINQIIDSLIGKKANLLNHSDRVALTDALNTMRKYQKITEIVKSKTTRVSYDIGFEQIKKVVEDGKDIL